MTGPGCDLSDEYFESVLGPEVMADIHLRVAAAPEPSPELVERLRRIFAPAVRQMLADREPRVTAAKAA